MRSKAKKYRVSKYFVFFTVLLALAIGCTYVADRYWLLELFSHFSVQYTFIGLALFVLLLFSRRMAWALIALVLTVSQAHQLQPLWEKEGTKVADNSLYEEVTLLQFNVHRYNSNIEEMARWIISHSEKADIVVLMEINKQWETALQRIKWTYPYHISKVINDSKQMVVLSKLLIDELEIKDFEEGSSPVVVLRGTTEGYEIPFVLYGAHPPPPISPYKANVRNNALVQAAQSIAQEEAPYKLLVGDLNVTRFSPWFKKTKKISGLNDSYEGLGLTSTWPTLLPEGLGLTIDHSLVSDGINVVERELGPTMGSDHYPVLTRFAFKVPENL